MSDVVRTSATAPQPMPSEAEVSQLLVPIVEKLSAKFGKDMVMLQSPAAPGVNKTRVCEIAIDMYGNILSLPTYEGGKVVRFMLAQI